MSDTKKLDKKPSTKKKKLSKFNVDNTTIIFFSILIIGMIVLTIILLKKPTSKIYSKVYGDSIETLIEVYNNNEVDIGVSIDGELTIQQGTYEKISDNTTSDTDIYNGEYIITFSNNQEQTTANMSIKDSTLILTYNDNTKIEFKERSTNGSDK